MCPHSFALSIQPTFRVAKTLIAGLLTILLMQPLPAHASTLTRRAIAVQEVKQYNIGSIPSQIVEQGKKLEFIVAAPETGGGTVFSVQACPEPAGSITIDPQTGRFSYTPAPTDRIKFNVIFAAKSGTAESTQRIAISPRLRPEATLLTRTYPRPDASDSSYQHESTNITVKNGVFNSIPVTGKPGNNSLKSIILTGNELVFETGSALYEKYNNKPDIAEMSIYADTVIIKSPLRLPQTNLTVFAKTLRFEDKDPGNAARIDTSPYEAWVEAAEFENGVAGMNAGTVTLRLDRFESPVQRTRFLQRGGKGQQGGPGREGTDGTTMPAQRRDRGEGRGWDGGPNVVFILVDFKGQPRRTTTQGTRDFPVGPVPAIQAGTPGLGGNGGGMNSNISIESYVSQPPGESASPRPNTLHGARTASPNPALHQRVRFRTDCNDGSERSRGRCWDVHEGTDVIDGRDYPASQADLAPPSAAKSTGDRGQFELISATRFDWLHPASVQAVISYAKDLYLNGYYDDAEVRLRELSFLLTPTSGATYPSDFAENFGQQRLEVESLLHRLDSHLDYFGNPTGYVPLLSLQANLSAYKKEVDSAIPLLYMTYWLGQKANELESKKAALRSGIQTLQAKVTEDIAAYNDKQAEIQKLIERAQEIASKLQAVQGELRSKEEKLARRANATVDDRNRWKNTLGTLSALTKVIPVYQPVLGTIGTGLEVLSNANTGNVSGTISQLGEVADQLKEPQFKQSETDLLNAIAPIIPTDTTKAKDYAKNVISAAQKFAATQRSVRDVMGRAQIPQSEVQAELAKLRSSDPEFISLANRVEELGASKATFTLSANQTVQEVSRLSEEISTNLLAIGEMNNEISSILTTLNPSTVAYLKEVERRAQERLLKYHYYVARAHEYLLLEPYTLDLNLGKRFNNLLTLASARPGASDLRNVSGHTVTLSDAEFSRLKSEYDKPLSEVMNTAMTRYNAERAPDVGRFRYPLTPVERGELNKTGVLTINLARAGFLLNGEDNQRILKISTDNANLKVHTVSRSGTVDSASATLYYRKDGRSLIRSNTSLHLFNLPDESVWTTDLDLDNNGNIREIRERSLAPDTGDLLRSLLSLNANVDQSARLYAQPGALGDILIQKAVRGRGMDIVVDDLTLIVDYTLHTKRAGTRSFTLDVQAPRGTTPYFTIDKPAEGGYKDGIGDITRIYTTPETITITAQQQYGSMVFKEWRESGRWSGDELEKGEFRSKTPSLTITMDSDKVVQAVYVKSKSPTPMPPASANNGICSQPSGLISWWRAESAANDSAGANNGALQRDASFSPGAVGTAFALDGNGAAVQIGNPVELRSQSFTIDAWVKRGSSSCSTFDAGASGVGLLLSYGQNGYGFGLLGDGQLVLSKIGSATASSGNLRITDTNFHHIAVTKSGDTVVFYVDGKATPAQNYNEVFTFETGVSLGARGDNSRNGFFGLVDEVRVFNRALSPAEIRSSMLPLEVNN
jgi:hypothetical protein